MSRRAGHDIDIGAAVAALGLHHGDRGRASGCRISAMKPISKTSAAASREPLHIRMGRFDPVLASVI